MTGTVLDAPNPPTALSSRPQPVRHLNQVELSRRWSMSPRTLERWRWLHQGPEYLKIGGRIVYRLQDVEAFEAAQIRRPATNEAGPGPK